MRSLLIILVLPIVLLAIVGCSAGQGEVSGKVMLNGKPLPGGRVTFRPEDSRQNSVSAELDREGNYTAMLPAGKVMVCIDNRELAPAQRITGGAPPGIPLSPEARKLLGAGKPQKGSPAADEAPNERPSGRYIPLPDKYYLAETSGLEFTVQRGSQKKDFELTK